MSSVKVHKKSSYDPHYSDNWSTPKHAYESIEPFVKEFQRKNNISQLVIWDPFFNANGATADHYMREVFAGAEVIYQNVWINFKCSDIPEFAQRANLIITNPPFSKKHKQETTQWLKSIGIPFISILPTETIMLKSFRPLVGGLQLVIPSGRLTFEKDGQKTKSAPLGTSFFCYGIGLDRDMNFL